MRKLGLKDLDLHGKHVLLRVDFNVPFTKDGQISDDSKITASLPSIRYILDQGASLILMSHLGRPKGVDPKLSLAPCAKKLSELLGKPVQMAPDCIGPAVQKMAHQLKVGQILMLENLRFHIGEEEPEKDLSFVSALASLGDVYVNDAFGTAHRAHASTALVAKYFPEQAAAGFLMEEEITKLSPLLQSPARPFYAIMGGVKVSTKIGVIHNLLKRVDALFLGGAMTFTFFKAQGIATGASPVEDLELKSAQEILSHPKQIHLPLDLVIADRFSNDAQRKVIAAKDGIPDGWQGMDIGPETVKAWSEILQKGATVFWNGPLGVCEMPHFAEGTYGIAKALAASKAEVIVGGGDSIAAIQKTGFAGKFAHLSTGGGASLEFLEYGHLPGIDALSDA